VWLANLTVFTVPWYIIPSIFVEHSFPSTDINLKISKSSVKFSYTHTRTHTHTHTRAHTNTHTHTHTHT